jgi:hypothetical protein
MRDLLLLLPGAVALVIMGWLAVVLFFATAH